MRTESKLKILSTQSFVYPLLLPPLEWCRGMGNRNCGQTISLHLCRSFLVTLCPCSNVGSLPQDAVLPKLIPCRLLTGSSSLRTAPTWIRTMGSIHQEQTAPTWVPHVQHPQQIICLLLHGLLFTGYSSGLEPAPVRALHGVQASCGRIHLLYLLLLHGL